LIVFVTTTFLLRSRVCLWSLLLHTIFHPVGMATLLLVISPIAIWNYLVDEGRKIQFKTYIREKMISVILYQGPLITAGVDKTMVYHEP
jgi:hypothetical protein